MTIKVPDYNDYRPSSLKASKTGKGNKKSGTKPEKLLIRSLNELGIKPHPSKKNIQGNPDLVFWKKRVVVFCDGDFWHVKNWYDRRKKLELGANAEYWVKKIEYNRKRDQKNNQLLKTQGWTVIRVWESTILKYPNRVAQKIKKLLDKKGIKA